MRSSIRWALVGWFGLLMALVVAAFGGLGLLRVRSAVLGTVDEVLRQRAAAITGALEYDSEDGWEIGLSPDYLDGLTADGEFAIWLPDGSPLLPQPEAAPLRRPSAPGLRTVGDVRELEVAGPVGTRVLVASTIRTEREGLRRLALAAAAIGASLLALGLLGGAWLARRSLAPVTDLTRAAAAVGPDDLARRLDEAAAPLELRELTRAFNAALERVETAFAAQGRFTADASHELRTPLAILRTQAEQALRSERSPETYRAALEACLRAAERLHGLVESLLHLARADSTSAPLELASVSLDEVAVESVAALRGRAKELGVALECSIVPLVVSGERALLGDVVVNLVDNALRYNWRGGHVRVRLERDGEVARLRVEDDGSGIPEHALPHVFERFFRVDPSRSRSGGGAGLGLAIARRIVEAHGGSIRVESRAGIGSAFEVRLPVASTTPAA